MRNLVSKLATASVVGSALFVAACGTSEEPAANNTMMEMDATDPMLDGTTNDVTAIDAGTTGADANLGIDANVSTGTTDTGTTDTGTTGTETNTTMSTDATVNGM